MSSPAPKRACDQCHTLKEKCRRISATTSCERCDRLSQTCQTTRDLAKLGRRPRISRKLSYSLPASSFSPVTHNTQTLDLPSPQNNTLYPDFHLPFDKGLYSNPAPFPELDRWERHFLNLMKDILAPSPLDKFLIGPSFHESHRRCFVQSLLRPAPTSTLKNAAVACAAVLLGDQYAQHTKTSVEVGYQRAALTILGLRSLMETFECLVWSEVPTIQIGKCDRCDVVDRFLGLSSAIFAHLYDLCEAGHLMKLAGGRVDVEMVERLDTIQDSLEQWRPSPPPDFVERFTQSEVVAMLARAKVLRLAALLILHRLRHSYGQRDKEAWQLSSAITAEMDMVLRSVGRSIPCTAVPYLVACFETTGAEARAAVIDKIHEVVTFSRQSQLQVRHSLSSVWDARDGGDQIYWCDIGDYMRKTPSTWTDV
ncbi:Protein of unknown function DUF3468 [Penicillium italicum]|uniref:Zn(2)-C6 fungal-type domain-containing protein n=1 Tax=Penicillium italicum TaxID=40296 RepID=A0A0A2KS45_PENIT|nr:Protein of unknown function DUF3468 [Penicillium italicum]